jgi:prepilin-type N-terminal cleavage/methylation domain-containing protein
VKSAFTLVEMLVSILLTALVFTYLYATLDGIRESHGRYGRAIEDVTRSQRIYSLMTQDLSQVRGPVHIVHEAGYDRIDFLTAHSVYGIARPWVHYYISGRDEALIRIESTLPIDFFGANYVGDANGTYFYADNLARKCGSLRFTATGSRINFLLECQNVTPIVATLYKGDR